MHWFARPRVAVGDIERMADKTLLSYGPQSGSKYSAFWTLLALAGVIATAGIVQDSTATVIGAMIVAPLMTPILGSAFALVMADRYKMARSFGVVFLGALLVIAIGFGFGLLDPLSSIAVDNAQVEGRVHPRLIDLLAALATGSVGAFALARSDISDTLPGVAIAISLVPPLAVVGITLQEQRYADAFGAALLFLTNVTAIVFTATMVLMWFQVRAVAVESGEYPVGELTGRTLAAVVVTVLVVAVPLSYGSAQVARDSAIKFGAADITQEWAQSVGWSISDYEVRNRVMTMVALGPPPSIDPQVLRDSLNDAGFDDVDLELDLVIGGKVLLPGPQGPSLG